MQDFFALRLAELCETKSSISEVSRDLNINRQQFARYLSGERRPRHPLQMRIAAYFGVTVADLHAETSTLAPQGLQPASPIQEMLFPFLEQAALSPLTPDVVHPGWYQQVKPSFSQPDKIFLSVVKLSFHNGTIHYAQRVAKNVFTHDNELRRKAVYNGVMLRSANVIMMIEYSPFDGGLTMSKFGLPNRFEAGVMRGVLVSAAIHSDSPVAARIALRPLANYSKLRSAVARVGFIPREQLTSQEEFALFGTNVTPPAGQLKCT